MRLAAAISIVLCSVTLAVCQATESRDESEQTNEISPLKRRILLRRNVWVTEYHFTADEKRLLEPSSVDQLKVAAVLQLPETGLIRLYPWSKRRLLVSVNDLSDGRTPDFNAHACTFSFSKEKHGSGLNGFVDPRLGWAELKLGEGKFFTGFTGESLGVIVALGDVPLETLTPESDGVTGLTNIIPPADHLEASALSRRNRAGFEMEKFKYGSALPVIPNTTYVLRSTSNRRADLLVGFRVVREDPEGSVTIVWRKLKTYSKPTWKSREE